MYHALLTNRYLTSRIIPFIAVAAVAMCVALVIIVVSVMTGFLNMVKSSGRTLMGDVVISYPVSGIPHYERLIAMVEALPEAEAATPVVDSLCLLKMPYPDGPDKQTEMVQFWGVEPESFAKVTGYAETIHWTELSDEHWLRLFNDVLLENQETVLGWLTAEQKFDLVRWVSDAERPAGAGRIPDDEIRRMVAENRDIRWDRVFYAMRNQVQLIRDTLTAAQLGDLLGNDARLLDRKRVLQDGLSLTSGAAGEPAIVLGMHVSEGNTRLRDGAYDTHGGKWWMPRYAVTLTTIPVRSGMSDPESRIFPVANEFQSGVFLIDDMRVMIPLAEAQRLTQLNAHDILGDEYDPASEVVGVDPARATMVLVRAAENVTPEQLRDAIQPVYDRFVDDLLVDDAALVKPPTFGVNIQTWEEQQSQFIGPVEKERELMRTLFSLVYVVCAGLVLSIFWAIVYEKTRDIGILRSVGASRLGISWIFLRYGLIVGTLGAIAGLGMGALVVTNINPIHNAMGDPPKWMAVMLGILTLIALGATIYKSLSGRLMPPVLGSLVTLALLITTSAVAWLIHIGGVLIWNPEVYYFSEIPNTVDLNSALFTMAGAVLFSLIGAFLPAAKAADVDPVRALHYE
jgi:lipoprotein-releasing system permease protein